MRVIIGQSSYGMTKREFNKLLKVASGQITHGIYAVSKGDIAELKNETYKSAEELKKNVNEYKKGGFKVYYNKLEE